MTLELRSLSPSWGSWENLSPPRSRNSLPFPGRQYDHVGKAEASETKDPDFNPLFISLSSHESDSPLGLRGRWGCLSGRLNSGPQRYPGPNPWTLGSVTSYGEKGLCRYEVRDLEMERLSWII